MNGITNDDGQGGCTVYLLFYFHSTHFFIQLLQVYLTAFVCPEWISRCFSASSPHSRLKEMYESMQKSS